MNNLMIFMRVQCSLNCAWLILIIIKIKVTSETFIFHLWYFDYFHIQSVKIPRNFIRLTTHFVYFRKMQL